MQVTTIGLDIAKNVFQVMASTRLKGWSFVSNCGAARCWSSSRRCLLAWSAWRPAPRPIIGRVN